MLLASVISYVKNIVQILCSRIFLFLVLSKVHTERWYFALFVLLSKHKSLADLIPLFLNPNPSAASQRGETQTRVQRAPSTPQLLNTYSALPFENTPPHPPPRLILLPRMRAHKLHTPLGALWRLLRCCSRKQMWEWRQSGVMLHYTETITLTAKAWLSDEKWWILFIAFRISGNNAEQRWRHHDPSQHVALFCQTSETCAGCVLQGLK